MSELQMLRGGQCDGELACLVDNSGEVWQPSKEWQWKEALSEKLEATPLMTLLETTEERLLHKWLFE